MSRRDSGRLNSVRPFSEGEMNEITILLRRVAVSENRLNAAITLLAVMVNVKVTNILFGDTSIMFRSDLAVAQSRRALQGSNARGASISRVHNETVSLFSRVPSIIIDAREYSKFPPWPPGTTSAFAP